MALVSVSELRDWIGSSLDADEISDTDLRLIEEGVVSWFETITRRPLTFGSRAEVLDGPGGAVLYLPYRLIDDDTVAGHADPVVELRSYVGESWTVLATSNYEISYDRKARISVILRTDSGTWPKGGALVRVTMPGGYIVPGGTATEADIPADLRRGIKKVCALDYASRYQAISISTQVNDGPDLQVPEDVLVTLSGYKNYYARKRMTRRLVR